MFRRSACHSPPKKDSKKKKLLTPSQESPGGGPSLGLRPGFPSMAEKPGELYPVAGNQGAMQKKPAWGGRRKNRGFHALGAAFLAKRPKGKALNVFLGLMGTKPAHSQNNPSEKKSFPFLFFFFKPLFFNFVFSPPFSPIFSPGPPSAPPAPAPRPNSPWDMRVGPEPLWGPFGGLKGGPQLA